jgi:hypothetical protein
MTNNPDGTPFSRPGLVLARFSAQTKVGEGPPPRYRNAC